MGTLPEAPTLPGDVASDEQLTQLNQQFTAEAGPGIRLVNLPLFSRYCSPQLRTSRVLASSGSDVASETLVTLPQLQQRSVERLLQYW